MPGKNRDPHSYVINEFRQADDFRFWKLHWFGQLDFNLQNLEPLVETTLVPLVNPRLDPEANSPELLDNRSYNFRGARTAYVGVGQLPLFGLGVFFQQGRPVARPDYVPRVFNDLYVGERSWKIIKAKSRYYVGKNTWEYYINYGEYALGGLNLEAKCLVIDVPPPDPDGVSKLIIPCLEIVRFHYANSSEMFREILTGGAAGAPNRIFNPARTRLPDRGGNGGYVQLSKFVRNEDAPIIARMAFSPYARAEANHIYRSMLNSYNNAELKQYIPEARLPFTETRATLFVHGKIIHCGGERFFLVFWVEQCNGPFPFTTFEFDRDNTGIRVTADPNRPYSSWPQPPRDKEVKGVKGDIEEEVIRSDIEPSKNRKLIKKLLVKQKFTDLENKDWRRRKKRGSLTRARPTGEMAFVHNESNVETLSTAPGDGDSTAAPLSVATDVHPDATLYPSRPEAGLERARGDTRRAQAIPASFHLFRSIASRLHNYTKGLSCEIVEVPENGHDLIYHNASSTFPIRWGRKRLSWSLRGRGERRQVLVAEGVYQRSHYFYLMEIDPLNEKKGKGKRTYTMLLVYDAEQFAPLGGDELREVLALCSKNRGAWLRENELLNLGRYKFKHASKSPAVYVKRIMEELLEVGALNVRGSGGPLPTSADR